MFEDCLKLYQKMFMLDWDLKDIMNSRHSPSKSSFPFPLPDNASQLSIFITLRKLRPQKFASYFGQNRLNFEQKMLILTFNL